MQNSFAKDSIQVLDNNGLMPTIGYFILRLNSFDYEILTIFCKEFCRLELQSNK